MTNAVGMPGARSRHIATWTGTEMIVFDGASAANVETDTGAAFRPRKTYWLYQKP
jgi:hypothetical protein